MVEISGQVNPDTDPPMGYRAAGLDSGLEASIMARALEFAAALAGSDVPAEVVLAAALDAAANAAARDGLVGGDDAATAARIWHRIAATAAGVVGLHPHPQYEPPRDLSRDRPALARAAPGQWIVAVGRRGRRWAVAKFDERGESHMTMTPDQLGVAANGSAWLHLQPLLALDPLGTRADPALATSPWRRLRAFLRLERRELWVVGVYAVVIGALTLATPIAVQALVNTVAFGSVLQPLVVLSFLLFGGLMFSGLLSLLEAYVVEVLQRRVFVRVADDFGRRLPALHAEGLETEYGPELANRFFDVVTIQKSMAALLLDGLSLTLQTAIGMVLLGFYHPLLLTFDVILVTLLVGVLLAGRGAVASGLRESSAKYKTAAWLQDISRAPHLFRGATARQSASLRTEMLCRDYLGARKSHFRLLMRQLAGGIGLQIIATVALLGVGGWLVIHRQLTLGQLVAAELVIAAIGAGFVKLGKNLEMLYDLNVGVVKVSRVVDLPIERRGGEALGGRGPAALALHGVRFSRGGRVLATGVELDVAPGERLRLYGPAGGGKSTMLDVLAGLRPVDAGSALIEGLDLRRIDLGSARDEVLVVRGTDFVSGSIVDNIRSAGADRTGEAAIREWLRIVDLERSVDAFPDGLSTPLTPGGGPLSETQARRLALVRALVCNPRVLLLDRGLDGLGLAPEPKRLLLDAVLGPAAPWTAVVVTDDADVAARCTRTACLQDQTLEIAP